MDALIEKIENARSDAAYFAERGDQDKAVVALTIDECSQLGKFLASAFGPLLQGKRDAALAEQFVILGSAFEGDDEDE